MEQAKLYCYIERVKKAEDKIKDPNKIYNYFLKNEVSFMDLTFDIGSNYIKDELLLGVFATGLDIIDSETKEKINKKA